MKKTKVFDRLDNVLGNYADGIADANDVVTIAKEVNDYLIKNAHPDDIIWTPEKVRLFNEYKPDQPEPAQLIQTPTGTAPAFQKGSAMDKKINAPISKTETPERLSVEGIAEWTANYRHVDSDKEMKQRIVRNVTQYAKQEVAYALAERDREWKAKIQKRIDRTQQGDEDFFALTELLEE